jgi:hypothetical protein
MVTLGLSHSMRRWRCCSLESGPLSSPGGALASAPMNHDRSLVAIHQLAFAA